MNDELKQIMAAAEVWTREPFDAETRAQVKKMMEHVGCNVIYLERVEFGNLKLDRSLKRGEYRLLTSEEIELLKNSN